MSVLHATHVCTHREEDTKSTTLDFTLARRGQQYDINLYSPWRAEEWGSPGDALADFTRYGLAVSIFL